MILKPRLLIAFLMSANVVQEASKDFEVIGGDAGASARMSTDEVVRLAHEHQVVAILISPFHKITDEVLEKLPESVKIVATCSVGYDHLDVKAGQTRKIVMTNTPDVLTDATADAAMLLLLGASRRAREHVSIIDRGWTQPLGQTEFLGVEVTGKTLGIIGMGRIGRAVAQRARGFNMKILYSNRTRLAPELELGAQYFSNYRQMLPHCQVLSLHAPATAETSNMIDAPALALLPKGAVLVNVARGSLIDEEALIGALQSGQVFAAGLDVFKNEPKIDPRLAKLPNVFPTPHTGSATIETRNAMGFRALENIRLAVADELPRDLLLA